MSIGRAEADLAAAQAEVSRLEAELEKAKVRAARLAGFLGMAREYGLMDMPAVDPPARAPKRSAQRMTPSAPQRHAAVVGAVIPVLRADAWQSEAELLPAVRAVGITLDGDAGRAARKLGAFLAKDPRIEGAVGTGWRLRPA